MTVYIGIDGSQAQPDVCFLDEVRKPSRGCSVAQPASIVTSR